MAYEVITASTCCIAKKTWRSECARIDDVWRWTSRMMGRQGEQPFRILTIVDCFSRKILATTGGAILWAYKFIEEPAGSALEQVASIGMKSSTGTAVRFLDQ